MKIGFTEGKDYDTAGGGRQCMELGLLTIADIHTCKSAAEYYGKTFAELEKVDNFPKGCYIATNDHVYFNIHQTGKENSLADPICYLKGIKYFLNQASFNGEVGNSLSMIYRLLYSLKVILTVMRYKA